MARTEDDDAMIRVPSFAYKFSDSEEVEELEKFANVLSDASLSLEDGHTKEAVFGMDTSAPWLQTAGHAAAITGGALGANLLGMAAAQGARAAHSRLTYRRDLNKILEVHPDLKDYSKKDINLAYTSIRTMNPTFAKDPLVGGNLLGQVLRNRDIHDPSKAPRFELGVAKELFTAERKGKDQMQETIQGSFRTGYELAVNDALGQARERRMGLANELKDSKMEEAQLRREARSHSDAVKMMHLKARMAKGTRTERMQRDVGTGSSADVGKGLSVSDILRQRRSSGRTYSSGKK